MTWHVSPSAFLVDVLPPPGAVGAGTREGAGAGSLATGAGASTGAGAGSLATGVGAGTGAGAVGLL